MARTRGPRNLVAQRPPPEGRTETRAHADYDAMISQDLGGRRPASYRAIDEGGPASAAELLMRPISLFLMACTAFVIVLCLWLWQSGVFGQLQMNLSPSPPAPSASWIGGRQARAVRPVDETVRPPATAPADTDSTAEDTAAPPESTAEDTSAD